MDEEMKKMIYEAKACEEELNHLQQDMLKVESSIAEYNAAKEAMNGMKQVKDNRILTPLGAGFYVASEVKDPGQILVGLGANVVLKKPVEDCGRIADEMIGNLNKIRDELSKDIDEVGKKLQKSLAEIQKRNPQMMQR